MTVFSSSSRRSHNSAPRSRHIVLIALLPILCGTFPVFAQQGERPSAPPSAPPGFVPTAPPNFAPPSGPPPGMTPPRSGNNGQSTQAEPEPAPASSASGQTVTGTGIVDPNNPMLQDIVGMIQIPDLGTNEVISMIEDFTGKPVLRQQSLPAVKITFFSQSEMTRAEAIRAIESLLALNGIALTKVGDEFIKAVPSGIINTQVPLYWEGSTIGAKPTQMIYEKIFPLDFLTVQEATQAIQPLMSQGAPIAFDKRGLLMVTDALINLQRIERVLSIVDVPSELKTEILFFQLKNLESQEALRRLQQIQQGPLRRQLENNTTFDADQKTNQLIVFTHPSNRDLINGLIEKMDVDVAPITTTKVFSIRYAEATEVVDIIDQVISGQKKVRDAQGGTSAAVAARQQQQQNQAAAAVRSEASNLQFSDFLTLVADERANSIVVSGTQNDIRALTNLIDQIDVLLAQVRIEVVITEITLSNDFSRGMDQLQFIYNTTATTGDGSIDGDGVSSPSTTFTTGGENAIIVPALSGVSFPNGLTFGPGEQLINFVLGAPKSNSNVKVLSAPTIVTTHNREAKISVGNSIPISTSSITDPTANSTDSGLITRTNVQYRDTGIELTVTPLIGSNGVVQLEVEQDVTNSLGGSSNGTGNPTITRRNTSSFVSVANGSLVVLGGLQQVNKEQGESRMFILGDLLGDVPVLGNLFKSTSEGEDRTELLIFIRPTIITDPEISDADAREQIDKMESGPDVKNYLKTGTFEPGDEDENKPKKKGLLYQWLD